MATIQAMTSAVRLRTDDPLPQKPSLRRVLQAVVDATQNLYNRLENTGAAWSVKPDYTLVVSSSVSDYLLAVDDSYGKPLQVLTYYPTNQSYVQRYVEFVELQDLNFNWGYPVNAANYFLNDGSNCTAIRMAFYYRDDGSRWVRVLPQPQLPAYYLISFASGDWTANVSLDSSPTLSQFHSLVETWVAQSILPSCQWTGDQSYNMAHRKELAAALINDQLRFEDEFNRYCRNLVDDHIGERVSSMDGVDCAWGGW